MLASEKKGRYRAIVPSFFTIGNMLCGFIGIIYAFQANYEMSLWMILGGGIFDMLDGRIARLLNSSSTFGIEYDSLADVLTFGATPSFMLYNAFFAGQMVPFSLLAFFPLLFGSIRLARYNAESTDFEKKNFKGLPIPLAALTIASGVVFWLGVWPADAAYNHYFISLVLLVSFLMVSRITFPALPNFDLTYATRIDKTIFFTLLIGILSILIWQEFAFFPVMLTFVFGGVLFWLNEWLGGQPKRNDKNK
jgi:CDP-diacylglycerol--serine O-phosphatidyltransferase